MRTMCGTSVMHSVLGAINRRDLVKLGAAASAGLLMSSPGGAANAQAAPVPRVGASRDTKVRLAKPVRLTATNIVDLTYTLNNSFPIIPVSGDVILGPNPNPVRERHRCRARAPKPEQRRLLDIL